MTDAPDSEGLILFRVDGISEPGGGGGGVGERGRKTQQQRPKRQKVPAGLHYGYQGRLTILGGRLSPGSIVHEKVYW